MRTPARWICVFVLWLGASSCEWYVDTVECDNGTVLNDRDECVAPPLPDGGVAVSTCAELCALVDGWDTTQLTCLGTNLGVVGPPPASCAAVLDVASCTSCIADLGTSDATCASAATICQ